jgi:hypothetical protein
VPSWPPLLKNALSPPRDMSSSLRRRFSSVESPHNIAGALRSSLFPWSVRVRKAREGLSDQRTKRHPLFIVRHPG